MQQVILHLSLINNIGPAVIQHIIEKVSADTDWADLYSFSNYDWRMLGLSEKQAVDICDGLHNKQALERELLDLEKHAINITTLIDDDYPLLLKHIHLPPPVLYWRGAPLTRGDKRIAVIGSRKANHYGERVIANMIQPLVNHGFMIVSGGAIGADSMAHHATVYAGGKTVVILGSGLLYPYPYCNKSLFERIVDEGGTIMSSFSLRTKPHPGNFPARNRIIAGLSRGVIVVQAAQKSGASITAEFALEQGRDVFAVPGPIDDELSAGCHRLIQQGAKLVTHVHDILAEYNMVTPEQAQMAIPMTSVPGNVQRFEKGSLQETIVQACVHAKSTDELAVQAQLPLLQLQGILFDLQVEGHIEQEFTGMWKAL